MHSCLYRGWVRHERVAEARHAFTYPTFMCYLSLRELNQLENSLFGFSASRFAPIWLRRRDHAGAPSESLFEHIATFAKDAGVAEPIADIRLLTNLRYWGHCFNPISVYYCFAEAELSPHTAVLEVTNTPWDERHLYVLPLSEDSCKQEFDKAFHVSPFMPLEMQYRSYIVPPGERLQLAISNWQDTTCAHRASLVMTRLSLTSSRLWRLALRHVSVTARNKMRIYWQAARLWLKGVRFHPHPGPHGSGNSAP